ncbi:MAG: glycosyltransferase family 4 protein [Drouetiella hepatica Uher 2000/2452]|uniref:Glycosyltransferase family 4 protein n=1 Tax=Drouetiella hepatica Uher 2000/2452 TaxID=904376 RepID=A0A951QA73_9CYAN|nr:glycosyltransferase family 4 protein [Drouetiella hepatica Uher 2000/2452]
MPLKISLLVSDLSQQGAGRWGGAVRPFLLAAALKQCGYEVKIFGFNFGVAAVLPTTDVPIVTFPGHFYPQFLRSARQLLKQLDGDIIYAYKPKPTSFGVGLLHKLTTGRPLLLDIDDWELSWHGGDTWRYRPALKQLARDLLKPEGELRHPDHPLYLQGMEKLVARADAVTTHTQFLKQRFSGEYVPNGKDTSLFNPDGYDTAGLKERYRLSGYRVLMFPGAPRPYKGVEDVLMALERLNQPDLRLVIVGGSPYDDYDQQLERQWGRWLIRLPKMPYTLMPDVIAAADAIVIPQRDTPAAQAQFPLKLTDGMAMAKPILATRVGDIPEILGDTGYLVEPDSPQSLAVGIQALFADLETAKAQGLRARRKCLTDYSIEAMAEALKPILTRVMKKR